MLAITVAGLASFHSCATAGSLEEQGQLPLQTLHPLSQVDPLHFQHQRLCALQDRTDVEQGEVTSESFHFSLPFVTLMLCKYQHPSLSKNVSNHSMETVCPAFAMKESDNSQLNH